MDTKTAVEEFAKGLRTSIEENSTAYGYSVMITVSFGALTTAGERPSMGRLFLMVTGAAVGFTLMEALSTKMFRITDRDSEYVALLGAAFNFVSIGVGLLIAWLTALVTSGWTAWLLVPMFATISYLLFVGLEITIAKLFKPG
jgi:hypothetical protein